MVTVRGAGLFGLATAWELARRGALVQVVDRRGPGAGSSGGIVGALAPHVPENWNAKKAFQLNSLLVSEAFWGGVEATSRLATGYGRLGRLQPLADAHAVGLGQGRAEGARALWAGKATWEVIPAETAGPLAPLSPTGLLIRDTLTARIHP
ncbi:MAG: FAD-dependent oxidoreductase, partial [Pseudomonadota bacterium]